MQTENQSDEAAFDEGFNKVAHGIPPEKELKAMSYVQLSVLLSSCEKGSPKYLVVEREMAHQANSEDAKAATSSAKKRWFEKPLGMLAISVVASLAAWAVLRFYGLA